MISCCHSKQSVIPVAFLSPWFSVAIFHYLQWALSYSPSFFFTNLITSSGSVWMVWAILDSWLWNRKTFQLTSENLNSQQKLTVKEKMSRLSFLICLCVFRSDKGLELVQKVLVPLPGIRFEFVTPRLSFLAWVKDGKRVFLMLYLTESCYQESKITLLSSMKQNPVAEILIYPTYNSVRGLRIKEWK